MHPFFVTAIASGAGSPRRKKQRQQQLRGQNRARILASRTVFVADDRKEAMRLAEIGLARQRARYATIGRTVFVEGMSVHDQIAARPLCQRLNR
jgi:alkanesulfonate monooxygenase SsuD/methylene tetrahydromethanopterin reductase-like flavin-dependent oxidoreductase (luciferase family)